MQHRHRFSLQHARRHCSGWSAMCADRIGKMWRIFPSAQVIATPFQLASIRGSRSSHIQWCHVSYRVYWWLLGLNAANFETGRKPWHETKAACAILWKYFLWSDRQAKHIYRHQNSWDVSYWMWEWQAWRRRPKEAGPIREHVKLALVCGSIDRNLPELSTTIRHSTFHHILLWFCWCQDIPLPGHKRYSLKR